jgi:malonate transporter
MNRMASRGGLADMALHGIASSWGNVGYMGIPLCLAAFGPAGLLPATLSTMIGAITFLAGAVMLVEIGVHANPGAVGALWRAISAVARNPLVLAVLGGMAWSAGGLVLPEPIAKLLQLAGAAAAPCALFAIGVFIADQRVGDALGEVGLATIGKLILQPLIVIALLPLFPQLDPMWAKAAILLAALPTASNAFIIANQYGRWVPESSAAVLLTTALSTLSVSLLLVALDIG